LQMEQKENQDGKTFAAEQKKKYALLRGVSTRESDNEIKETLKDYGYQIQEVKRFHKMPIVKTMISDWMFNGESGPFDKSKLRPKSHFKQCRKCYRLNHIVRECPKKHKVCKYCRLANHEAAKYRYKNDPSKHKFDSLQCDVIRKAREKLGIKLTRKEDAFLKKKALQLIPIKSDVQRQPKNYSYTDAANGQQVSNGNQEWTSETEEEDQ
ncbi:hypothetical protein RFI_35720, partial [Reticulomyxa filosa]